MWKREPQIKRENFFYSRGPHENATNVTLWNIEDSDANDDKHSHQLENGKHIRHSGSQFHTVAIEGTNEHYT